MKIYIKTENATVPFQVYHNDSVALLKALYQESGKCLPDRRDYIILLFKGKELEDETTIGEHGIVEGSILHHIEAAHRPFRGVNYRLLADALKQRHHHEDENLRMLRQENIWACDERGTVRSLGIEKSLISVRRDAPHRREPPSSSGISTRSFYNSLSVRIGGANYSVLPRMEGRWNGEMAAIPIQEGTQVCSSELTYHDEDGVWSQRQTRTSIGGLTTTHHFWLKPISDGILKVESDDPGLRSCDITMQEQGGGILLTTAVSKRTGKTVLVETTTLVDTTSRVRTIQRFDESGVFRYVLVKHETRVVDAVSGALQKYGRTFSSV